MGDVKDAVKGSGSSRPTKDAGKAGEPSNIIADVKRLKDEVSALTAKKDDDAASEGDAARPENLRKAALLRASHSLLVTIDMLLEKY